MGTAPPPAMPFIYIPSCNKLRTVFLKLFVEQGIGRTDKAATTLKRISN